MRGEGGLRAPSTKEMIGMKIMKNKAQKNASVDSVQAKGKVGTNPQDANASLPKNPEPKNDPKIQALAARMDILAKMNEQVMKEITGMKAKLANLPDRAKMEELQKSLRQSQETISAMPKTDAKALKELLAKSGYLENQSANLKAKIDNILKIMDMFTDNVNSIQKDLATMKKKAIQNEGVGGRLQAAFNAPELLERMKKAEKDIPGLRERIEEVEEAVDKLTDMFKSVPAPKSEQKGEAKAIIEKILRLENSQKDMEEIMEKFNEKVNSLQRLAQSKSEKPSYGPEAKPTEMTMLKSRVEDIEDILEKVTERLKSAPAAGPSAPPAPPELKDVRLLTDRVFRMQSTIKDMRERLASMDEDIAKAAGQSSQTRPGSQIPQEPPVDIKPVKERLDSIDTRITGISDKLMQLSGDAQKLSNYFMEGMKYMEEKIKGIEKTVGAEDRVLSAVDSKPITIFKPTTYRSHLKQSVQEPIPDDDIPDDDYEFAPSPGQVLPRPPSPPRPAQAVEIPEESLPAPFPGNLPPPPSPDKGNIFTKLREGTVVKKPYPSPDSDSADIEIITEQIWESMHRHESREKITRDLMNAGFEKDIIDKAFMQMRTG